MPCERNGFPGVTVAPAGMVSLWLPGMTLPCLSTAKDDPTAVGTELTVGALPPSAEPTTRPPLRSPGPATTMEAAVPTPLPPGCMPLPPPPMEAETGMLKICCCCCCCCTLGGGGGVAGAEVIFLMGGRVVVALGRDFDPISSNIDLWMLSTPLLLSLLPPPPPLSTVIHSTLLAKWVLMPSGPRNQERKPTFFLCR